MRRRALLRFTEAARQKHRGCAAVRRIHGKDGVLTAIRQRIFRMIFGLAPIPAAHRRFAAVGGPDGEVWMTIGLYFKDMAAGGSQKR